MAFLVTTSCVQIVFASLDFLSYGSAIFATDAALWQKIWNFYAQLFHSTAHDLGLSNILGKCASAALPFWLVRNIGNSTKCGCFLYIYTRCCYHQHEQLVPQGHGILDRVLFTVPYEARSLSSTEQSYCIGAEW